MFYIPYFVEEMFMNLSFKEKGLIVTMVVTVLIFGNYFLNAFDNLNTDPQEWDGLADFVAAVVLIVILEITIFSFLAETHAANNAANNKVQEDERDKLIERISYRNSYWCLSIGVWFLVGHLLLVGWFGEYIDLLSPYILGNLLLLFFVLAEVTNFITQLYYYRKGI